MGFTRFLHVFYTFVNVDLVNFTNTTSLILSYLHCPTQDLHRIYNTDNIYLLVFTFLQHRRLEQHRGVEIIYLFTYLQHV